MWAVGWMHEAFIESDGALALQLSVIMSAPTEELALVSHRAVVEAISRLGACV